MPKHPDRVWSDHIICDTSITLVGLDRVFEQIFHERALPQVLRTDNGPELLGEVFVQWAKRHDIALQYIEPGKPNQNAFIERSDRTYREKVIDRKLFPRLDDARETTWQS